MEINLKDKYRRYFKIGVATSNEQLEKDVKLILKHFNTLTIENEMKPEHILVQPDTYDFSKADKIVDFAIENKLDVRGHTLVWHNQTPLFLFDELDPSNPREEMIIRLRNYITKVMEHYKGKISVWDVVNEAIEDKGETLLRDSPWLTTIGEDYIDIAFHIANEVNPDAELFYNDYNATNPLKRQKIIDLIKGMIERNVPIHGIGLQGHWNVNSPSNSEIREAIEAYAELGLKIHITEMDLSVFNFDDHNKYEFLPDDLLKKQTERYQTIFEIFREYKNKIDSVTFWGVTDRYTWLDDFPVQNRKNWPFIFDEKSKPKDSFFAITDFDE